MADSGRFHTNTFPLVFIKTANFSLRFHLASARKRWEMVFKVGKFENDIVEWYRCRVDGSFSLKTQFFKTMQQQPQIIQIILTRKQ